MALMEDCHVRLTGGRTFDSVDVLLKENGFTRVSAEDDYLYFAPGQVEVIIRDDPTEDR